MIDSIPNFAAALRRFFTGEKIAELTTPASPLAQPQKVEDHAMSVFSKIIVDVEKFFKATGSDAEKFATAFWKLFKKAPNALQQVENFLQELSPTIVAATELIDPVVDSEVAAALATAETAVAACEAAATAATTGTSLLSNLEALDSEIPSLLSGLDVKDAKLKGKIAKIANLITGEAKVLIPAVESWIAEIKSSGTSTTSTASAAA